VDHALPSAPSRSVRKGSRHATAAIAVALLLAGCGTGAGDPSQPAAVTSAATTPAATSSRAPVAPTQGATPPPTAAPTEPAADFPVTLTDDEGTEVTIDERPDRIIGLSPAITETLFALGVGPSVVGGTDFDDHPPEAVALPDVATFTGVLIEQVVDLEPDVVFAAGNAFTPAADIERMRGLDIPVVVVYAEDVDEVLADIELIGRAVGATAEAETIVSRISRRIEEVRTATAALTERPRVFYQLGSEPEIYGPAPGSFIADMIVLAGGAPITTGDPTAFSIPLEKLVTEDPEVIVVGDANYGVCPDDVMARPAWRGMTAVRRGDVRPVDDIIVTRPGPRFGDGVAALASAIHPDLELPSPPPPFAGCAGANIRLH
jgi:iron complex transport system substrate-binding protein